jgi:hypothetical protein
MTEDTQFVLEPEDFSLQIELYLKKNRCDGYVSAILKYCTEYCIDIEDVVTLIPPTLKAKLAEEANEYGVLIKDLSIPMMRIE